MVCGEAFASGGFSSLTIQNASDDIIGVMSSKATKQRDRIFVGVIPMWLRAWQREIDFRESAASPAQSQMGAMFRPIDGNHYFFQKRTQKFFAIAIRGGRRGPDFLQIGTESAKFIFFFLAERTRALLLSSTQLRFGCRQIAQAFFPRGFQPARH